MWSAEQRPFQPVPSPTASNHMIKEKKSCHIQPRAQILRQVSAGETGPRSSQNVNLQLSGSDHGQVPARCHLLQVRPQGTLIQTYLAAVGYQWAESGHVELR